MRNTAPVWLFIFCLVSPVAVSATSYYISPGGSDSTTGLSEQAPFKTFQRAFSAMGPGDELILLDGEYSNTAGTGIIEAYNSSTCPACSQPPSGTGPGGETVVRARNPGRVTVNGRLRLGTKSSSGKVQYVRVQGILFEGGGTLYNTASVTIKECGFHSLANGTGNTFSIGTNDHNYGNSYNLIEDCWVWGRNRIMAINYRADNNVWRRVVVRGDGCNSTGCTGSGNPNVGFTVYNSSYVSVQNLMVLDRILGGGQPGADFATAQHAPSSTVDQGVGEHLGPAEWLGCISLNSEDNGFNFEADRANDNTFRAVNLVSWNNRLAVNTQKIAFNTPSNIITMENITAGKSWNHDNIRVAPEIPSGTVRNLIAYNAARYGVNSNIPPSYVNVYGAAQGAYNQTTCTVGCQALNPLTASPVPPLKYITRIESGSALKGTGYGGADYGANVVNRYGAEGSRYGDTGYNTLTDVALWPWPNEARIRAEMCQGVTRGFCASQWTSLTEYIWEQLGNPWPPPDNPPGPPGNPALTSPTSSSLTATWAPGSGNPTGYRLDIATDTSFSSFVQGYEDRDVGNVTQEVVTGLAPATTYFMRVRAYDAPGNLSGYSATASGTTADSGCLTASYPNARWKNQSFAPQSGIFTAEVDVTPSSSSADVAVSLSSGAQTAWSGLAVTVLFHPDGTIKLINGGGYTAGLLSYSGNTTYHIRLVVDVANHTYSAYVKPAGGTEQVLGTDLAFRTSQATVTSLDHWTLSADATSLQACGFAISNRCLTAAYPTSQWRHRSFTTQSGTFTAEVDVTPSSSTADAGVSLSSGAQTAWSGLAVTVLFHPSGSIQLRDGGAYTAGLLPYSANTRYHLRLVVDVPSRTYSAYITPAGGTEQVLGTGVAFRSTTSVSSLDHWTLTADAASILVCDFVP